MSRKTPSSANSRRPVRRYRSGVVFLAIIMSLEAGFACQGRASAQADVNAVAPPIAGQPVNFSGAIGSYAIVMQAEPKSLQAEDSLTLTIRITVTGAGSLEQIRRPNLKRIGQFAKHFVIQDGKERDLAKEKTREFEYVLRPKNAAVKQIPAVPFVYFNPAIVPASKGYQWAYARAIPLTVRPRAVVGTAQVKDSSPPRPPVSVLEIATGAVVLRNQANFALPGWEALLALAVAPPILCGIWLVSWRRRHPDAARVTKQRRSRAARLALKAIAAAAEVPHAQQAPCLKEAVTQYLGERFDLAILEPTPVEVSTHLQEKGLSGAATGKARQFFGMCDAARFAPQVSDRSRSWTAAATELVHCLEEESWPAPAP